MAVIGHCFMSDRSIFCYPRILAGTVGRSTGQDMAVRVLAENLICHARSGVPTSFLATGSTPQHAGNEMVTWALLNGRQASISPLVHCAMD
jgi:hypothetical protein